MPLVTRRPGQGYKGRATSGQARRSPRQREDGEPTRQEKDGQAGKHRSDGGNGDKPNGDGKTAKHPPVPVVLIPEVDSPRLVTKQGSFDLDDPVLPDWVEREALKSGGYPYDDTMKDKLYEEELETLQVELVKLQHHAGKTGLRIVIVFEGRDAAGKGGAIFALRQYLNPRSARIVALPKPSEAEAGQWYFQRYVAHMPTAGEIVLFDRSWYNRGGVEPVMGFCTPAQCRIFLKQAPAFEKMLVEAGIVLFKFWLDIGRAMQLKQFHQRRHDPLKIWKLSPMDYAAMAKWDAYTAARDEMLAATHTKTAPWTFVRTNDKKRGRLAVIRHVLGALDYAGKDKKAIGKADPLILSKAQPRSSTR
jgi:polyphosphate kinase 2